MEYVFLLLHECLGPFDLEEHWTILHTQSQVYDEFMLWEQNTQLQRAHTHTVSERSGWTYQWTLCVSVVSWGEAREYGFQNMFFYDLFMKILRNAFMNKKCLVFTLKNLRNYFNFLMCSKNLKIFIK